MKRNTISLLFFMAKDLELPIYMAYRSGVKIADTVAQRNGDYLHLKKMLELLRLNIRGKTLSLTTMIS